MTQKDLILGNNYTLRHTGAFCACYGIKGYVDFSPNRNAGDRITGVYMGTYLEPGFGYRNLFVTSDNVRKFVVFEACINLTYIVK
jgi:hypothetical protein